MVRVQSALPCGAAVASYLQREGVAPLTAGGTLYSDEREVLDAERDNWQPSVAVHFGAKLLKWAMLAFGQGIPRVLLVLNPTSERSPFARSTCGRLSTARSSSGSSMATAG